MTDKIETVGGSTIQHGPDNNRIYLMKLDPNDLPELPEQLDSLAKEKGYAKIFAKVPDPCAASFRERGYRREGAIPRFYNGKTTAVFLGKFLKPERAYDPDQARITSIIDLAHSKTENQYPPNPQEIPAFDLIPAREDHAIALAELYGEVFDSYPFPIQNPRYLIKTMQSHVRYFVAEHEGKTASAAASEMDTVGGSAEMTDFATRPKYRGNGLATQLLAFMEAAMASEGIITLFTIARALSPAMNITFARRGYAYGGTLINNTQIAGSIESMNLWYKSSPIPRPDHL